MIFPVLPYQTNREDPECECQWICLCQCLQVELSWPWLLYALVCGQQLLKRIKRALTVGKDWRFHRILVLVVLVTSTTGEFFSQTKCSFDKISASFHTSENTKPLRVPACTRVRPVPIWYHGAGNVYSCAGHLGSVYVIFANARPYN